MKNILIAPKAFLQKEGTKATGNKVYLLIYINFHAP